MLNIHLHLLTQTHTYTHYIHLSVLDMIRDTKLERKIVSENTNDTSIVRIISIILVELGKNRYPINGRLTKYTIDRIQL